MLGTCRPIEIHERIPYSPADLSIGGESPTLAVISPHLISRHSFGLLDGQMREAEIMCDLQASIFKVSSSGDGFHSGITLMALPSIAQCASDRPEACQ